MEQPMFSLVQLLIVSVRREAREGRPNQRWVSDFTYVSTWQGFVYVAFVVDVFARYIVGWRASRTMHTEFVLDALEQVSAANRPGSPGSARAGPGACGCHGP
jgi:putative transposase